MKCVTYLNNEITKITFLFKSKFFYYQFMPIVIAVYTELIFDQKYILMDCTVNN